MNKHLKEHSQRLNIKTTQLASLTAVFHSKKQRRPAVDNPYLSAMDIDKEGPLPEPNSQVGGLEAIPGEPTTQGDGSKTDNDNDSDDNNGSNSDGASEELLTDLDSGDEFESDEEDISGCRDGTGKGQGLLEFELRAAEAGSVPC